MRLGNLCGRLESFPIYRRMRFCCCFFDVFVSTPVVFVNNLSHVFPIYDRLESFPIYRRYCPSAIEFSSGPKLCFLLRCFCIALQSICPVFGCVFVLFTADWKAFQCIVDGIPLPWNGFLSRSSSNLVPLFSFYLVILMTYSKMLFSSTMVWIVFQSTFRFISRGFVSVLFSTSERFFSCSCFIMGFALFHQY